MLTGALILLAGLVIGYLIGRVHKRPPRPPKQPQPICGCEHHLALHDPKSSACSGQRQHVTLYENGIPRKWVYYSCDCKQYIGPEYLPQYVALRSLGEEDEIARQGRDRTDL